MIKEIDKNMNSTSINKKDLQNLDDANLPSDEELLKNYDNC